MGFSMQRYAEETSKRHHELRGAYRPRGSKERWPWIWTRSLPDGEILIRLLPAHPEKCRRGYRLIVTHTLDKGDERQKMLCLHPNDCFCCDLLESAKDNVHTLTPQVKEALSILSPVIRVLFPVAVKGEPVEDEGDFPAWVAREDKITPAVFDVRSRTLLTMLETVDRDTKNRDLEEGRWLELSKNGNVIHHLIPVGPREGESLPNSQELMKGYPPIDQYYSKNGVFSYEEQEEKIRVSWWGKQIL